MKVGFIAVAVAVLAGGCELVIDVNDDEDEGNATEDGSGSGSGLLHPDCAIPVPEVPPPLPAIATDLTGRPLFDLWRDLPVGAGDDYACDADSLADECVAPAPSFCEIASVGGTAGFCRFADADIFCDGEGELLTWRDGQCRICAPPESRAAMCDAAMPGVDCRAWPYDFDGVAGTGCARHEDCEPGLVCSAAPGGPYGICQCPEFAGDPNLPPLATCF